MSNGAQTGADPGTIGLVIITSLFFGIIYAIAIYQLKKTNRLNGYTAFAVVIGVLITVALSAFIIGIPNALYVIMAFTCSGVPMIFGDIIAHQEEERQKEAELRQAIGGHNDQA